MHKLALTPVVLAFLLVSTSGAAATRPTLAFRVFAKVDRHMNSVVWTGTRFLYVENTTNTVWAAGPAGAPITQFATMPNVSEETRCIVSPGTHGFPSGVLFCNSPDDKLYAISLANGATSVFATLPAPYPPAEDGALVFDGVGKFGYRLVAATGRSGAATPAGGTVYTIDAHGGVQQVGTYAGPGGADEAIIAPSTFGTAGGDVLLTVDAGPDGGAVLAMDPTGATRTILRLSDGPNPIATIPAARAHATPAPGLYVTDDTHPYVYYAPLGPLHAFTGDVLVGTENKAQFWVVAPKGARYAATRIRHNLRGGKFSLEQMIAVG